MGDREVRNQWDKLIKLWRTGHRKSIALNQAFYNDNNKFIYTLESEVKLITITGNDAIQ